MRTAATINLSEQINPTEKQKLFISALFSQRFKYILYGGAAGGGKSYILRWAAALFCLIAYKVFGIRNVIVGIFCENYPQLTQRHIVRIETEFPRWLGRLKDSKKTGLAFHLNPEWGGGIIMLLNLDEPGKYDSVEFAAIFVDELTKNLENIFDELRKRLRWAAVFGKPHFPCGGEVFDPATKKKIKCDIPGHERQFLFPFAAGSNPGSKGHGWVKKYWIDRIFTGNMKDIGDLFFFIKSLATDNPYNPSSYFDELGTLPELMRKAFQEGDWNMFVGQFLPEWQPNIHIIPRFDIPKWWVREWAGDWGYNDHFCGLTSANAPTGDVFIYREVYVRQMVAEEITGVLIKQHSGERLASKVLDPSAWNRGTNGGVSIGEIFERHGWACLKADNDVINGWANVREYLAWSANEAGVLIRKPKLYVLDGAAPHLCRTLPNLVFKKDYGDRPEDIGVEDHAPVTLRYLLKNRPLSTKVPLERMPEDLQEAIRRAEQIANPQEAIQ